MTTDTLSRMKMKRNITLICVFLFLGGLIAYSVLRPDAEEQKIAEMKDLMLSKKPGKMSRDERKEMRKMLEKLSPGTRKKLIREVMRGRLEEMRADLKDVSEEEKRKKIDKVLVDMRKRFNKMTPEQRDKARERMNTPEGKERMGEALDFFYKEFTPAERQLMDPIVEEFTVQMGRQ
jgi:uncharacterized protein with von Willebrand factor type A (vWA) domain